jgi:site-specific DNA recombinase
MRVGTYARISDDAEQLGLGVARQQHDTRSLVELRGWTLVDTYQDDDKSAYQRRVVRPDFERMLDDLGAGVIQGIVVYDLDRLARKPTDLERIIDLYDKRPLVFATVQGDIDLSTPDGRTMARVLVAFANKASMDTARRMARKKLEKAMDGVGFSNYRPFGWNDDRLTINESEAEILRQATRDILSGSGIFVVCDRLNKRGIRTVRGNIWKTAAMRRVLSAPRMAGFAVYQGELLTNSSGQPIRGKWEPILDEATWRAVAEVLRNTKRHTKQRGNSGLLSNIARCGKCGKGLHISRRPDAIRYVCPSTDAGGCAGIAISAPKLDAQIEALIFAYLNRKIETPAPEWDGQARLDEVSAKIGELMEQYRSGLSGSIVFPMVRKLETEQSQLRADAAEFAGIQSRKSSITIAGEWDDLDLHAKRAVIRSVIEAVVVKPVARTGHYDPSRVDVVPLA